MRKPPDDSWVDHFLSHLEGLSRSSHTIAAYRHDLATFQQFCTDKKLVLLQATTAEIETFLEQEGAQNKTSRSVARTRSALSSFYKYALKRSAVTSNPCEDLHPAKTHKPTPIVHTEKAIERLLDVPGPRKGLAPHKSWYQVPFRDRAILEVMYATGIRVSELSQLQLSDVESDLTEIQVIGKGRKSRRIPLTSSAQKALERYLLRPRPILAAQTEIPPEEVFLSNTGRALSRHAIKKIVQKHALRAGLENLHPHSLRHAFASHLVQNGADLRSVQELLGHSDIRTAEWYARLFHPGKQDHHRTHHPRE